MNFCDFMGIMLLKEVKKVTGIRKPLTSLGYLMERLGISSAMLAKELHLDASLVRKWKRGSRSLSRRLPYFQEVLQFFWDWGQHDSCRMLLSALQEIHPTACFSDKEEFFVLLSDILEGGAPCVPAAPADRRATGRVEVTLYDRTRGHRYAMDALLKMAEMMDRPGHLIFIESELFSWLLDDKEYCALWCRRLYALLNRGFTATIALHFTLQNDLFSLFFVKCSPLLFHRNIEWYAHNFYDDNIYYFSFAVLEHSMSIMTIPLADNQSTSMVFTDSYSVQQHKNVAATVLRSCRRIFRNFSAIQARSFIELFKRWPPLGDVLYTFLPVPAMIYAEEGLLRRILSNNNVSESVFSNCLEMNRMLHAMFAQHRKDLAITSIWEIFQIEEMERRINEGFISCSLSLLGLDHIIVERREYAQALENIVGYLKKYPWFNVALVSEKDQLLPNMNCWCMKSCWTAQMDDEGLRFCDEPTFSTATSTALEISLRQIPAARKNKTDVEAILGMMIRKLRSYHAPR